MLNVFRASFSILLILLLLRVIPFIFPESRTWGINHLIFFPYGYTVGFFALGFLALAISFTKSAEIWGSKLCGWFSKTFYESRLHVLFRAIFIAISAILFIVFAAPTHFLGDGYSLLSNIASETGTFIKWSEQGITWILLATQSLIGPKNIGNALKAFQIISVLSGIITLWMFFKIAAVASDTPFKRFLIFAALTSSPIVLMFFGYVESYPILWVGFSAFLYFSLKYIKTGTGLPGALLFLLFGIFIHLQMFVLIPAFIYLLFCRGKGYEFYLRHRAWFIGSVVIMSTGGLLLFAYKYSTDLYFENMFLPPFVGKPIYPIYALISWPHLLDVVNQLLLLSPLLPMLLILSVKYLPRVVRSKETTFLLLSAIGTLAFLLVIDPTLTMARDWDLFSNAACAVTILSIYLIHDSLAPIINRLAITILILLVIMPLPFLLTNLNEKRSIEYVEHMIDLDLEKSFSSIFVLNQYFIEHGYKEKADSLQATYNEYPFPKSRFDWAIEEIKKGNIDKAWAMFRTTLKDHFDQNYHVLLKELYLHEKNYAKALEHADKAIQLQRYADYLYGYRGEILLHLNRYDEALRDFRRGYELDNSNPVHPEGIAAVMFRKERPDSGIYYTQKMLALDSTKAIGYYMLAQGYLKLKNMQLAQKNADRYALFAAKDSSLVPMLQHLLASIKRAEKK